MKFPLLSKTLAIGGVVLLLCLMLMRIDSLVAERRWRQTEAAQSVEQSLAGSQTLLGPLLHRTCTEEWDLEQGEGKDKRVVTDKRDFALVSTPETLQVVGDVRAEARYRGIFKVNGFAGPVELEARWPAFSDLQPQREHMGSRLRCGPTIVMLAVSDVRGLRTVRVQIDGEAAKVAAGTGLPRYPRGLHAQVPEARSVRTDEPLLVKVSLELVGTARLSLVPAAGDTAWSLRSDWPHPSFGGRFLPTTRQVDDAGFAAHWTVSSLVSSAAQEIQRNGELCTPSGAEPPETYATASLQPRPGTQGNTCLETLSVAFIDPINPYVLTDRATKYAMLFIVLTYASVALVEVLTRRRVHPVQYALVGTALALFYLLLLSLSEHMAFGAAYALASAACVGLLGFYAAHMLNHRGAGAVFGAGVGLLYAVLWVLLRMEQSALVIGSSILFMALAVVMVLTRRVDWYAMVDSWRAGSATGRRSPTHGSANRPDGASKQAAM